MRITTNSVKIYSFPQPYLHIKSYHFSYSTYFSTLSTENIELIHITHKDVHTYPLFSILSSFPRKILSTKKPFLFSTPRNLLKIDRVSFFYIVRKGKFNLTRPKKGKRNDDGSIEVVYATEKEKKESLG